MGCEIKNYDKKLRYLEIQGSSLLQGLSLFIDYWINIENKIEISNLVKFIIYFV